MKVKDLIVQLRNQDPEAEVLFSGMIGWRRVLTVKSKKFYDSDSWLYLCEEETDADGNLEAVVLDYE